MVSRGSQSALLPATVSGPLSWSRPASRSPSHSLIAKEVMWAGLFMNANFRISKFSPSLPRTCFSQYSVTLTLVITVIPLTPTPENNVDRHGERGCAEG